MGLPVVHSAKVLNLRNLDAAETAAALFSFGVRPEVARQIFARVQRHGDTDLRQVRALDRATGARIEAAASWPELRVLERRQSADGFVKYLFALPDDKEVEAVRIPLPDPKAARVLKERRAAGAVTGLVPLPAAKYTICVSSQVGCALACAFCATGKLGVHRNLETWEILAQIRHIAAEAGHPVRGVVFMGMGEPFLNYDNVLRAARILSDPAGPAIAANKITFSTAGVLPKIIEFTRSGRRERLVFSIGSPFPKERAQLMPIEKRWPLVELFPAIRDYARATRQRATLAYVAIGNRNMSRAHAQALAALVGDVPVRVNLIEVTGAEDAFQRPSQEQINDFFEILGGRGIPVVRRYSGGADIAAACGTLAATRTGGVVLGD